LKAKRLIDEQKSLQNSFSSIEEEIRKIILGILTFLKRKKENESREKFNSFKLSNFYLSSILGRLSIPVVLNETSRI